MSVTVKLPTPSAAPEGGATRGRSYTAGFSDPFGDRQLVFDPTAGSSLEILRFKPQFSDAQEFEAALRLRVDQVGHLQHPSLATIHAVERADDGVLTLVSRHVSGRRVSELLPKAHGPSFALELIRLVTPALAAIQRTGDGIAHGALSADRIVVTRDGRLVVVEHVLGSAIESLMLSRERIHELGLVVPEMNGPVVFDARTDMTQLGFIALSLLLGRRLEASDYPPKIHALLDEFVQGAGSPIMGGKLRTWLERAMQISGRSFTSARDAHDAFSELPDDLDVKVASASGALLEFPTEGTPTPGPMPIPHVSHENLVEERKPQPRPVAVRAVIDPIMPPQAPVAAKKTFKLTPWIIGALGVLAVGEAAALFVMPMFRSAPVIEVKPPATAAAQVPTVPAAPAPAPVTTQASTPPPVEPAPRPADAASVAAAAAVAVPAGKGFGGMTVTSPIELQVFKDGQVVGSSAGSIALNDGTHNLEFVNEALGFRYRQTVNVRPGQMTNVKIAVPNGRISINAVPWADVLIDGTAAGQTPLANLSLPIGSHEITFRHPQFGEKKQTVVVKAEGLLKITQTLPGDPKF
jgi:hypothetical protein